MNSRLPARSRAAARRGFTLVEIMVVCVVSILLMTTVAVIYVSSLRLYRESQGMIDVYATAQLINRDLRQVFGNIVAMPGGLITPVTKSFGGNLPPEGRIDPYYLSSASNPNEYEGLTKDQLMAPGLKTDRLFSKSQYPPPTGSPYDTLGYSPTNPNDPSSAATGADAFPGLKGWWMPAFYGKFDGNNKEMMEVDDNRAGSWGWPRPDYRMDVNLDGTTAASGTSASSQRCACWFYAENRNFASPLTLALDNSNIVLVSLKFTARKFRGKDVTQLSVLRHQINGFDTRDASIRSDMALGEMLRAFKVVPRFMRPDGNLTADNDDISAYLGASLSGMPIDSPLSKISIPRCFDISYTLANPANQVRTSFSLRVYNQASSQ